MIARTILRRMLIGCSFLLSGTLQSGFAQTAVDILTRSDLPQNCVPNLADSSNGFFYYSGCCGAPGRRPCVLGSGIQLFFDACSNPPATNKPRGDPYRPFGLNAVCNLPTASCDSALVQLRDTYSSKAPPLDVSFYVTSDLHPFRTSFSADSIVHHVDAINAFAASSHAWPPGVNIPGAIPAPLAVIVAGDLTTHGQVEDLGALRMLWERGTMNQSIAYPVYPGLGNHDISTDNDKEGAQRMYDYLGNLMCGVNMDPGSHNYSWDWNKVHFVQLNTWAGDTCSKYPHAADGLTWLRQDLASKVGRSGRPVVLIQHYTLQDANCTVANPSCSDSCWWHQSEYTQFQQVIQDYNVIGLFSGHTHDLQIRTPSEAGLPSYTDSKGRPKNLDNFVDGRGGEDGRGDFMAVHVTDNYLDVASLTWNGGASANYSDPSTFIGAPPLSFTGNTSGCRKRINDQFLPVPTLAAVVLTPINQVGNQFVQQVKVKNIGSFVPGPIALKIETADTNVTNRSFVDGCSRSGNSYILLSTQSGLAMNQEELLTVQFATRPSSQPIYSAIVLTPINGAVPNQFQHATAAPNVPGDPLQMPGPDTFTVYGRPSSTFVISTMAGIGPPDWIKYQTGLHQFDQFGRATVQITYDGSSLTPSIGAVASAQLQIDTGEPDGLMLVDVSLTFKAALTMTLTSIPAGSAPVNAKVVFTSHLGPDVKVGNVTYRPTGIVSLREEFTDAAGNVISTNRISTTRVNSPEDPTECPRGNPPPDDTVVFGDDGTQFCPSHTLTGGDFVFSLPPGQHRLAAYYEGSGLGDDTFAPATSPPVILRVGGTPASLAATGGTPQSTGVGVRFDGALIATVRDAAGNPVAGYPVHFSGPASGPGVMFNGAPSFDAITDSLGQAQTPVPVANGTSGSYQVTAQIQPLGSTVAFSLTNLAITGAPAITAGIYSKPTILPGTPSGIWQIQLKNSGAPAYGVQLDSVTFTQEAGTACSVVAGGLPAQLNALPSPAAFDLATVRLSPQGCLTGARFTVTVRFSANGGLYSGQTVIGHQFL